MSGSANGNGGSCISGSSSSPVSKACVVSETIVTKSVPKHAVQAYRVLSEIPAAQVSFFVIFVYKSLSFHILSSVVCSYLRNWI